MEKVNNMLKGIYKNSKQVIKHYPATLVLIMLLSLTSAIFFDRDEGFGKFIRDHGIIFLMLWGFGSFFIETCGIRKRALKYCGIALMGLIAAGLVWLGNSPSETVSDSASNWGVAWSIVMISLGIYRSFKNSGMPFNRYCLNAVYKLAMLMIICSITSTGVLMVMGVFVTLILNNQYDTLIIRAEIIIQGCLAGFGLLYALSDPDTELPRFFTAIIKYLLMVMLIAAFAIIYGYILKIIITRVVPSNEIFRILAALFVIGLPIWTMTGALPEDHLLVRIGVKLPYIFIPFLFLQWYAIRERIAAFGITPLRYLCLALMVFEIIYIAVYALRDKETGIMLPILAGMAVISFALPYVNMYSTANRSQKAIFDRFIVSDFADLSTEDQSDLAGAYYYLAGNAEGKALLSRTPQEKIEAIKSSGMIGEREYDRNIYFNYEFPMTSEDIRSFSRITSVTNENAGSGEIRENYDPEKIEFYDAEGNLILTADLSGFINRCISAEAENQTGTPDFSGTVDLGDGKILRITQINCGINTEPEREFNYLYLNALLLERE